MLYVDNIVRAISSTFEGMAVTMSWMFRRPMTIQYPDKIEKPIPEQLPDGYRGLLECDVGICTGCGACAKACPIGCIAVVAGKNAATNERELSRFDINVAKCMHCGLCTEACPTGALRHTTHFEIANPRLEDLVHRFVTAGPVPVYKVKKDVEPPTRPVGEALVAARRGPRWQHASPSGLDARPPGPDARPPQHPERSAPSPGPDARPHQHPERPAPSPGSDARPQQHPERERRVASSQQGPEPKP